MAEDFVLSELVIPGTYVRVRAEALISAGGISSGNIGIVGTASQGDGATHVLSDFESAKAIFGNYDALSTGALNLTRGLELLYQNGARTVFARALLPAGNPGQPEFTAAFNELLKEEVNILVAPQLSTDTAKAVFGSLVDGAEGNGKDVIAVIGSDKSTSADIKGQVAGNDRIIFTAPGIEAFDAVAKATVTLPGTYSAAVVAGLISSLTPQTSPTNKVLPGVVKLAQKFTYGEMVDLVKSRICLLEERQGVRIVRGVTTDNGAFTQITTRRITDFAKAGIRQVSNPFIGRLNNQRVRKALQGAIDGFLTTMVQDEALITYELEVTASRQDEIAGRCLVNVTLQPTFSIDFIAVTMVLQ
ncbi:MAG: phage tail sheath protein [Caldilinea sp. CFX5]|nr:phage tail sheath protein [Caldilinea sp. CFX5]